MRKLVLVSLVTGITVAVVAGAGAGAPAASRVVDRTFVCTTDLQAGVRKLYVAAQTGFRETPARWKWLPSAIVTTDGVEGRGSGSTAIAGISAGTRDELGPARIWIGTGRCKASQAQVPLAPGGLHTRSADVLGDDYACVAPARVLLRVRVVFTRATKLRLHGGYGQLRAQAAVDSAALAVRTLDGKPFAYATVARGGGTRLWSVRGCRDT